jgi:hypothetical protein
MSTLVPYKPSLDQATGHVLLAPLQGLPFDLMVANGMPLFHLLSESQYMLTSASITVGEGNRHAGESKYYRLILIHGLFAALAFLVFTPAAIICSRFLILGPKPRLAMFGHIGFQITSLFCLTITFISGYFAVGKANWGSNPHHVSRYLNCNGAVLTGYPDHRCDYLRNNDSPSVLWCVCTMEGE